MARSETPRRVKSYSAATGYVYQYYFYEVQRAESAASGSPAGNDYTYVVSVDRKTAFPLRIRVRHDALEAWRRAHGRALTGTEEYALAKMRLFAAFDEVEDLAATRPELEVDQSNLGALLATLDI